MSTFVESQLKQYTETSITRFAGQDRYETSTVIAKELRPDATTSVFASGEIFSDALVAGALVEKDNSPLILLRKNDIPDSVKKHIKSSKIVKNIVVGGENTISDETIKKLEELENRK